MKTPNVKVRRSTLWTLLVVDVVLIVAGILVLIFW